MILGVGVDIVDVADFEARLGRETVLNAFSEAEQEYADSLPQRRAGILAARWAAKEAFGKALGSGLRVGWPLREIEVAHDAAGRPFLNLGDIFQAMLPEGARVLCSLSHTRAHATACVIIEAD
jgi:holo-[acyl-carrier protein] synthase